MIKNGVTYTVVNKCIVKNVFTPITVSYVGIEAGNAANVLYTAKTVAGDFGIAYDLNGTILATTNDMQTAAAFTGSNFAIVTVDPFEVGNGWITPEPVTVDLYKNNILVTFSYFKNKTTPVLIAFDITGIPTSDQQLNANLTLSADITTAGVTNATYLWKVVNGTSGTDYSMSGETTKDCTFNFKKGGSYVVEVTVSGTDVDSITKQFVINAPGAGETPTPDWIYIVLAALGVIAIGGIICTVVLLRKNRQKISLLK